MKVAVDDTQYWLAQIRRSDDSKTFTGGGDESALRAFRAYHPAARVHYVEFAGRSFWLTDKQFNLWCIVRGYSIRGRRITLETLADRAGCSRATVSRFLKRLDLWRVVDVATIRGRDGGTYILTIRMRSDEADANLSGARHTYASRRIARDRIAQRIRQWRLNSLKPRLEAFRATLKPRDWHARMGGGWASTDQAPLWTGRTDATFSQGA